MVWPTALNVPELAVFTRAMPTVCVRGVTVGLSVVLLLLSEISLTVLF